MTDLTKAEIGELYAELASRLIENTTEADWAYLKGDEDAQGDAAVDLANDSDLSDFIYDAIRAKLGED